MGPTDISAPPFGELYGLLMALDLVVIVVEDNINQKKNLIYTDNQAAITSSE